MKKQIAKIKYQKYPVKLKLFAIWNLIFGFRRAGRRQTSLLKNAGGMTGVEFIIALTIVGLISVVLFDVLREGINTWKYQDVQTDVSQQSRRAMEMMVREIRQALRSSIVITTLDANRTKIQFSAPLELEQPDDVQTVTYEPQVNGELWRTVNYVVGASSTNVVATSVTKLFFYTEYEEQISIRLQVANSSQTVNMAAKVYARNQ